MVRYNHMFTIAFSLENQSPTGEETTAEELQAALLRRVADLIEVPNEIVEAVGMPDDTYEVEPEQVCPNGFNVEAYISDLDGKQVVQIDTDEATMPCNNEGPTNLRIYINDDTDNPIWDN